MLGTQREGAMPHDVFISYSSSDKPVADATCAGLENDGVRCWIAPRNVRPGQEYAKEIVDAVSDCRLVVLVFSSGANGSPQVRREVERAVSKGKIIIPFRIEDAVPTDSMEHWLASIHWLDAVTPPLQDHLGRLSHVVHACLAGADDKQLSPPSKEPGLPGGQLRNVCRELIHRFRLTRQRLLEPDPRASPNASRLLPLTVALDSGCAYGTHLFPEFEDTTVRQIIARWEDRFPRVLGPVAAILSELERLDSIWRSKFNEPGASDLVQKMAELVDDAERHLTTACS